MPDWDKINQKKRLEIVKGQTANMVWHFLFEEQKTLRERLTLERLLKRYETAYPKLLEVNRRLLLGGDSDD